MCPNKRYTESGHRYIPMTNSLKLCEDISALLTAGILQSFPDDRSIPQQTSRLPMSIISTINATSVATFASWSSLGQQHCQVFRAQVANHAVLGADHCGGKVALGLLKLQDFLLNRVAGNQAIGEDGPRLSNAMRAVYGLRFNRGVPPRIENEYILGGGQIQTQTAGLQADKEEPAVFVILEALHSGLAVTGGAVKVFVDYAVLIQAVAENLQQAGELREHQRLVSFVEDFTQLLEQHVQLGAGITGAFRIEQAGMASSLPQAQQCLQD